MCVNEIILSYKNNFLSRILSYVFFVAISRQSMKGTTWMRMDYVSVAISQNSLTGNQFSM